MDLSEVPLEQIEAELKRRGRIAVEDRCPTCRKWPTTYGAYRFRHATLNCYGCLAPVNLCTCGRA